MFKKLRNKFIIINLVITSIILTIAYSAVYFAAKSSAESRTPIPNEFIIEESNIPPQENTYFRQLLEERVYADRQAALNNLLFVLIITGALVEVCVLCFSYLYAEEAIKPVKEAYETQKIFIANASHEIKTPVAAIKANLEAADLSEENHWIKNIEIEADKIESLNLSLLKLAKSDIITETPPQKTIKLKHLVEKTLKSFDSRIKTRNITLKTTYKINDSFSLKTNPSDLQEILEILTDNAIKYSKSLIEITATQKSLSIKNDGKTIPKEKLQHIFDRFYQVDKSSEGSGLGLSIADSLSKRNNWTISAKSDKATTTFLLTFN